MTSSIVEAANTLTTTAKNTIGEKFGRWFYILRRDNSTATFKTSVVLPNGTIVDDWLPDNANIVVTSLVTSFNLFDKPWRVLVLGGDHTGNFNMMPLYDTDADVNIWDIEPNSEIDYIGLAMDRLGIKCPRMKSSMV